MKLIIMFSVTLALFLSCSSTESTCVGCVTPANDSMKNVMDSLEKLYKPSSTVEESSSSGERMSKPQL